MRCSVDELRAFYRSPLGGMARRLISHRLDEAWGEAIDADVLGLGYATPFLDGFSGARRTVAAMPGGQGVEGWPSLGKNRTVLVDETQLPFRPGTFDRVLMVHVLEEAADPAQLLSEAVRVLAPAGRIILVAAARGGLWSRADSTPFGYGRPFTVSQLERLTREAGLEPTARAHTLFVPPWKPMLGLAEPIDSLGRRLIPGAAGLILLEAARQAYAMVPTRRAVSSRSHAHGLNPQPAARACNGVPRPTPRLVSADEPA